MTRTNQLIHIGIDDDHQIFRDGLRLLISKLGGIGAKLAFEADSGEKAISLIRRHTPDIIFMDVEMPGIDGIEATKRILDQHPSVGVIALSSHNEATLVLEMVNAGARGYLLKNVAREELQTAILKVNAGRLYFTPDIADHIKGYTRSGRAKGDVKLLTDREKEVVRLICEGKTNKEIATELGISKRTVDGHRENIMDRLEARHVMDILVYAIRYGIYKI